MAPSASVRGGPEKVWTREKIIEALRRYAALYGGDFTTAAFNPATARWRDRMDLVDVYVAGDPETGEPWPSLNTIKAEFGSFNKAREAAGLPPNKPGSKPGGKRANGKHRPRTDVVVPGRVVYREKASDPEELAKAERARARAEARVERLEAELARVKERAAATPKPKLVKVTDSQATERLQRKLDRALAAVEAAKLAEAEAKAAAGRLASKLERAEAAVEVNEVELRELRAEVEQLRDQLRELRRERVRVERVVEVAPEAAVLRAAQEAAAEAEARAVRAEAAYAELAAASVGEPRRLTREEIDELRRNGPAGPVLLANALKALAKARTGKGSLRDALTEVASAAVNWRERL